LYIIYFTDLSEQQNIADMIDVNSSPVSCSFRQLQSSGIA